MRFLILVLCSLPMMSAFALSEVELGKIVAEINKISPKMLDSETQLLKASSSRNTLVYHYKMVNYAVEDLDVGRFRSLQQNALLQTVCSTIKPLLNAGVNVAYSYVGKNGKSIAAVTLHKSDCK